MNNRFEEDLAGWSATPQGITVPSPISATVHLAAGPNDREVLLEQIVPDVNAYEVLSLSCDLKSRDLSAVGTGWHAARAALLGIGYDGQQLSFRPHTLDNLTGTRDWVHREGLFPVYPDNHQIKVVLHITGMQGDMWVRNLSLRPMRERTLFQYLYLPSIGLWVVVSFWVLLPVIRSSIGNIRRMLVLALAGTLLLGVLIPESVKQVAGNALFPSLARKTYIDKGVREFFFFPLLREPDVYLVAHFTMFTLIAAVMFAIKPYRIANATAIGYLMLFAFLTEVVQLLTQGRTAQLSDFVIDTAGIALGLMFGLLWRRAVR